MRQLPTSAPNPQQQQAIHTTEGPLLIIAGPGSGKTFTLVERIYYLISEKGRSPECLFVSTFTEKAAAELITRISDRLASSNIAVNLNEMYVGTFHSICLRFLKEYREFTRLKRNFTLLDRFDQQYFIYQRLFEYQDIEGSDLILGGPKTSWWRRAANLMTWVNKVSEEALDPEDLLAAPEPEVQALGCCYRQYQAHLDAENCIDFSVIYAFSGLFYDLLQFPLFSRYLGDESAGNVMDSRPARNLAIFSQLLSKYEYLHHINILTPEHLEKDIQRLFNRFFRFLKEGGIDEYEDASDSLASGRR